MGQHTRAGLSLEGFGPAGPWRLQTAAGKPWLTYLSHPMFIHGYHGSHGPQARSSIPDLPEPLSADGNALKLTDLDRATRESHHGIPAPWSGLHGDPQGLGCDLHMRCTDVHFEPGDGLDRPAKSQLKSHSYSVTDRSQ